jgi:hypothetical protein
VFGVACLALATRSASAQALLTPASPTCSEEFGAAVSASAGRLLVGACTDNDKGSSSGSAHLYEQQTDGTWTLATKLLAADGAANDDFGYAVAVDGDRAVAGAYQDDDNGKSASGSAYVFERQTDGTWTQTAKLLAADPAASDWFGYAVAVSGTRVVVGARQDDDNGSSSGSAYVFEKQTNGTWLQVAKLLPTDGAAYAYFGCAVALDGDTAAVGADHETATATDSGAVYLFTRQSNGIWAQTAKLKASDAQSTDYFGQTVALHGAVLAVGAPYDNDQGTDSGSAYVFTRNGSATWTQTAKLLAPAAEGDSYDKFGSSVATDGWHVLAGTPADEPSSAGAAYLFQLEATAGWTFRARLTRTGAASSDEFGTGVALNGDCAFSGAPGTNGGSYSRAGSTTVFAIEHSPTDIALAPAWVAHGVAGATVGTLSATDLDAPESFAYAVKVDADLFEAAGSELRLKADKAADWGTKSSHTVEVTVTDRTGHELTESFAVAVNRLPTADAQTVELADTDSVGITLTGNDPDGHALTFEISENPASGSLTGTPPALTYTPYGIATSTTFAFRVIDELGGASAPATVSISLPDRDANGLPDWWEVKHFTFSPTAPNWDAAPGADPDGDGLCNQDECTAGTDPHNPDSEPEPDGGDGFLDGWEYAHMATGMDPMGVNTIQDAVDAAADNETVILLPGTYSQKVVFAGRGITLTSCAPSDPVVVALTVLQGDATDGSLVYFNSAVGSAAIRGLTIAQGLAQYGGGVYCDEDAVATVADCVLEGNRAALSGGAVFANVGSELSIERCTIRDNDSERGGGVFARYSTIALTNCYVTENGNRAFGYPCTQGGGVSLDHAAATVLNCTIAANSTTSMGMGAGICTNSVVTVTNSIVYGNTGPSHQSIVQIYGPASVSYSCIQNGWGSGTGNLSTAPLFTDADSGDFSLQGLSPCIDAATATGAPAEDRYGDARPCPRAPGEPPGVDMGADEYSFSVLLIVIDPSGAADPPAGTYNLPWGTAVTVAVPSATVLAASGRTRLQLSSISGTGSAPPETEGAAVVFTITADSEVSFVWATEHLLSLRTIGEGAIKDTLGADAAEGWYPEGTAVLLRAVPKTGSVFASWAGNLPAVEPRGPEFPVTLSTPVLAVALFRGASSGTGTAAGGAPDYQLTLKAGWNLISFPVVPALGSTELPTWAAILEHTTCSEGSVDGRLWAVVRQGSTFVYRITGQPRYGEVYWVYAADPQSITLCVPGAGIREPTTGGSIEAPLGWSALGFDVSDLLDLPAPVLMVWTWDPETGYTIPDCSPTGEWDVTHGRGYLVFSSESWSTPRPLSLDSDDDGLEDIWESSYAADEANPDTDGDGLLDGWEVENGTSPATPDTDQDGVPDSFEISESLNLESTVYQIETFVGAVAPTEWEARGHIAQVLSGLGDGSFGAAFAEDFLPLPYSADVRTTAAKFTVPASYTAVAGDAMAFDLTPGFMPLSVRLRFPCPYGPSYWVSRELLTDDCLVADAYRISVPVDLDAWFCTEPRDDTFDNEDFVDEFNAAPWFEVAVVRAGTNSTDSFRVDNFRVMDAAAGEELALWLGSDAGTKGGGHVLPGVIDAALKVEPHLIFQIEEEWGSNTDPSIAGTFEHIVRARVIPTIWLGTYAQIVLIRNALDTV